MCANPATRPDDKVHRGLAGIIFDETRITDIRGQAGELRYRGYAIEELADNPNFENVAYLLLRGEWPSETEAKCFHQDLASRRVLPPSTISLLEKLRKASTDDALRTALSALDLGQHRQRDASEIGLDLIAKIPSMIAVHHAHRHGRDTLEPDPTLDHAADFLRRILGREPTAVEREVINLDFVLHADHGANASTFAARVVASTGAGLVAATTAAMAAFAGPLHGGAMLAGHAMISEIESPGDVSALVAERRQKGLPVYGFGHRVYRTLDPRATPYRQALDKLAQQIGDTRTVAILEALIDAMAPYRRMGIDVNVDLFVIGLYELLGLEPQLATGVFVAGRSVGWIAQVLEQQANNILIRPRLRYVGPDARRLNLEER